MDKADYSRCQESPWLDFVRLSRLKQSTTSIPNSQSVKPQLKRIREESEMQA